MSNHDTPQMTPIEIGTMWGAVSFFVKEGSALMRTFFLGLAPDLVSLLSLVYRVSFFLEREQSLVLCFSLYYTT